MKVPRAMCFALASVLTTFCAVRSAGGQAKPPAAAPYAVNPAITEEPEGTYWLSYTLKNFGPADMPMRFKVQRPAPKSPLFGWPAPVLGPGNNGSWVWIGEGAQSGTAAIFLLEASGKLTWVFVSPQVARMYLPKAEPAKPAERAQTTPVPAAANAPAASPAPAQQPAQPATAPAAGAKPKGNWMYDHMPKLVRIPDANAVPSKPAPAAPAPRAHTPVKVAELPAVIHLCAAHCMTWKLEGTEYRLARHGDVYSKMEVENFAPDLVILHRTDPPIPQAPNGLHWDYVGKMNAAGDKVVEGTETLMVGGPKHLFFASWGTALDDYPGQDAPAAVWQGKIPETSAFPPPPESAVASTAMFDPKERSKELLMYFKDNGLKSGIGDYPPLNEIPLALEECEADSCEKGIVGIWTFRGSEGLATWSNGMKAKLTLTRFDPHMFFVHREDLPGTPGYGIKRDYNGYSRSDQMLGDFTLQMPNGGASIKWYTRIGNRAEQEKLWAQQQLMLKAQGAK